MYVCITIQDDGQGFDSQLLDGKTGTGLVNVRERLRIAFPEGDLCVPSHHIGFGSLPLVQHARNAQVSLLRDFQQVSSLLDYLLCVFFCDIGWNYMTPKDKR